MFKTTILLALGLMALSEASSLNKDPAFSALRDGDSSSFMANYERGQRQEEDHFGSGEYKTRVSRQKLQSRDAHQQSSYAEPSQAPAQSYEGGSQGNIYYYYYPVEEYGHTEIADAGFDVFTALILPLLILGGILLGLSSLTFTVTGRALRGEKKEPDLLDHFHDEIERAFYVYLNALESEECIQRSLCEMGAFSRTVKGKDFILNLIEPLVPEPMKNNLGIFKQAALSGYEAGKCKKYKCKAPKIL